MPSTLPQRSGVVNPRAALALAVVLGVGACDDTSPTTPGTSRFGQVGVVELLVESPISLGIGALEQRITWTSRGDWELEETILYESEVGDASIQRLRGDADVSAGVYAQWISQVNEAPGLNLFVPTLDPTLDPICPGDQSRVTLRILDDLRDEQARWVRCAPGSLRTLTPTGSGPDPQAARVVNAAALIRDFTVGSDFQPAYQGSLPFATLLRGEDAATVYGSPAAYDNEFDFRALWGSLSEDPLPPIDFERQIVFLAAVGVRTEAGDSVEVRRIVPVESGTIVDIVNRVPGDFCSPASRRQAPFHIVVAPRVSEPVVFSEVRVERVPCG
jgi:hypothetical protein